MKKDQNIFFKASNEKSRDISVKVKVLVWYMKYTKINDTTSIKYAQNKKIFLGGKYFWNTQIGLSAKNDTKFQSHRNIHTINGLFNWIKKKNTRVKWKHIHTNEEINQYVKKFFFFTSSNLLSIVK